MSSLSILILCNTGLLSSSLIDKGALAMSSAIPASLIVSLNLYGEAVDNKMLINLSIFKYVLLLNLKWVISKTVGSSSLSF